MSNMPTEQTATGDGWYLQLISSANRLKTAAGRFHIVGGDDALRDLEEARAELARLEISREESARVNGAIRPLFEGKGRSALDADALVYLVAPHIFATADISLPSETSENLIEPCYPSGSRSSCTIVLKTKQPDVEEIFVCDEDGLSKVLGAWCAVMGETSQREMEMPITRRYGGACCAMVGALLERLDENQLKRLYDSMGTYIVTPEPDETASADALSKRIQTSRARARKRRVLRRRR